MITVKIDNQGGCDYIYWDDDWKIFAYGEDFDEHFVINANREYTKVEEAKWYTDMMDIQGEFDNLYCFHDEDDIQDELKDIARVYNLDYEIIKKAYEVQNDEIKMLNALNPGMTFKKRSICGYCQRDWNEVIYEASDEQYIKYVEAFYFGMVADVYTDDCSMIITDDELWKLKREGKLVEYIKENLGIADDEEVEVLEADGYIQTTNWKKVC